MKLKKLLLTAMDGLNYLSLARLQKERLCRVEAMPFTIRILIENILRNHDSLRISDDEINNLMSWSPEPPDMEMPFLPARVLMQDFTGVPAVVDIASIRSEMAKRGFNIDNINPVIPVDLVIDHSVQVEFFGTKDSFKKNAQIEYARNGERYQLLKWAQKSLEGFRVVPPGMGIVHQVNLEYLSKVVVTRDGYVFPDTLVGTDSHTPMVNGMGVLGWGVGGIEAEAVMLGQPVYMPLPKVIGLRLLGRLPEGTTTTDLVLKITELLRGYGVVGRFVEVSGEGLDWLTVPDRATISNMSPEFGCTATLFPPDDQTIRYMKETGRSAEEIGLVERYLKENLLWRNGEEMIEYTDVIELDISTIEPSVAGPKRPQDRIPLTSLKKEVLRFLEDSRDESHNDDELGCWEDEGGAVTCHASNFSKKGIKRIDVEIGGIRYPVSDGAVAIAAITSCTNTSNPGVMIGAGLLAKRAVERGLSTKPWVKTSLAPGSRVVTGYLEKSGLLPYLEALRFHIAGYGCTTCIGNSGPLPDPISKAIRESELILASVLSGNRNFEARIHPLVRMNFLASPALVVAFAIAGRVDIDIFNDPLGFDPNGKPVYLKDILPSDDEIKGVIDDLLEPEDFIDNYRDIFEGEESWQGLPAPEGKTFEWNPSSTYIKEAPFFKDMPDAPEDPVDIKGARALLVLGDSITTDHISPAGAISPDSPAGRYLVENGVRVEDFNSYGSRRGNHEVMVRGTFANPRLRNLLVDREGGWTVHLLSGRLMPVFDAAMEYIKDGVPLIVIAGREYGSGSSRDWAAKGTLLLGIKAVIAESYERIHRSNLVGMGVLPLKFKDGENRISLGIKGDEIFDIAGLKGGLTPRKELTVTAHKQDGGEITFGVTVSIDSEIEIEYYRHGGILPYMIREGLTKSTR